MMRAVISFLLAVCSLTTQAQQAYRYRLDFTVWAKHFVDTVEIEVERDQIYIPVNIGGQRLRFKLDTGSSQGVVYHDTPITGLRPLGTIRSEDATGRSRSVTTVELPPVTIGSVTISGYKAAMHQRQVRRHSEDGIIGFDLFRRLAAKIDVRNRRLILTDQKKVLKNEPGHALPYKLENHTPRIVISPVCGQKASVVLDTGSRQFLSLNHLWACNSLNQRAETRRQLEGRCLGQMAIGNFGVEQESEVLFFGLDCVSWDDLHLLDVHCTTTQGNSHIGTPLLRHGVLTINPFRRRLVFQPYEAEGNDCPIGNQQLRIAMVPRDGKAAVGLIWEQSEAYRQGFRQGDVIEEIDGRAVSFDDFIRFRAVYDRVYTFTLRNRQGTLRRLRAEMPTLDKTARSNRQRSLSRKE